jgi:predicted TIM-barrel fold metal-dependent hydrolase
MIIDAHLHCSGGETTGDVLHALDEAGVDMGVLLAPFLSAPYTLQDAASLRLANQHLSRLVAGHTDRLVGFAVVNPLFDDAVQDLDAAITQLHLRGL